MEPSELAVESLPNSSNRKVLSFYEAAEGGAGVLRQVVTDPNAVSKIARVALELCHYNPDTGEDLGPNVRNGEGCEAACYDCLLDYGNQRDHRELDRSLIKDVLLSLSKSQVSMNAGVLSRESHVSKLYEMCDSKLEKKWLKLVEESKITDCPMMHRNYSPIISPSPTSFMPKVLPPSMWTVLRMTIPIRKQRMRK